MHELTTILRRLPVGVKFAIDIRPEKPSEDFPNIVGTLVRHNRGFAVSETTPEPTTIPAESTAVKKPVAKKRATVRKS